MNTLRFSCQRFDTAKTDLIYGKSFKDLYRHINVRMSRIDEKILFDFLMLNGPTKSVSRPISPASSPRTAVDSKGDEDVKIKRAQFNLKQLDKLIDYFAKEFFSKQQETSKDNFASNISKQQRQMQMRSLNVNPNTTLELLLVHLQ